MKNYFEIFGLKPSCDIDIDDLEAKYIELQRQFHPDKNELNTIEESMLVNEAFEVLSNKKNRLSYLVKLNGIDIENDSLAPKVDQKTLFEILEIQEKIFESSKEELLEMRSEIDKSFKKILEISSQNIEANQISEAAQNLIKARYFEKTLQDIKKLLKNS